MATDEKTFAKAAVSKITIERVKGINKDRIKVSVYTAKPGVVIGRDGETKNKTVEKLAGTWATNKKYADSIKTLVEQMRNTTPPPMSLTAYKNGTYNARAKVTADTLNVRAGRPGSKKYNNILGTLKEGEIITVRYCLDNWFGIIFNGKQAFVCGKYIDIL